MHVKFQVAEFQIKSGIRHRSLDFFCLFLLGQLLVRVIWWFLASDCSGIYARVEDFKHINKIFTSNL